MKNSIKKVILVLCAASVMLISTTALATSDSATNGTTRTISASDTDTIGSSGLTGSDDDTDTTGNSDAADTTGTTGATGATGANGSSGSTGGVVQGASNPVPTAISMGQNQTGVVQTAEAQREAQKKYVSKGVFTLWVFLLIIINAIVSFVISNRFYKLARKDNHVTSEIRALRRDLEEKFVSNVGGFNEMETDVANTNDNYSLSGSIKMPERKSTDFAAESEDVFKRWENQMSQRRAARRSEEVEIEDEPAEEEEERPVRKKFRPDRKPMDDEAYEDDDEVTEEDNSAMKSVKDKAKNLLGDIFPFKED